jgi:hypothetical protein
LNPRTGTAKEEEMKKSQWFPLAGFLIGWGAPLGALALRFISLGPSPDVLAFVRSEWALNSFFYWYMLLGTCGVLTWVGYLLGRREDRGERKVYEEYEEANFL